MNRRRFLGLLPGLGLLFLDTGKALGKSVTEFLDEQLSDKLVVYPYNGAQRIHIPIWWRDDIAFVSSRKMAEALDYNTYFNPEKKKLVLYLPSNKVVVGADNPFVMIDGKPLQMPATTLWQNEEIYVPVSNLIELLNKYTLQPFRYSESEQVLKALKGRSPKYSVNRVEVDNRDNGVIIRIKTAKTFKSTEMTVDTRYDWLHVDLYGATANVAQLRNTSRQGKIREVKAFQFKQLLSIGLRLREQPNSREIYQDEETKDVIVLLKYDDKVARKEEQRQPEEQAEDVTSRNDQDVQDQLESERKKWLLDTIVIDPGHGGRDPGAIGVGKLREKDVTLSIGTKLGKILAKKMPEVKVIYTRKTDKFVELRRRTQIANENGGKLFVSIHANANRDRRAAGFETYILGTEKGEAARSVVERENAVIQFEDPSSQQHYDGINVILATMAQSAFLRQSEQLAARVQREMARKLTRHKMKDRGVKQAPFWVMVGASMPCILVETGFITNRHEAKILKTARHQQEMAESIFAGLKNFKEEYESAI